TGIGGSAASNLAWSAAVCVVALPPAALHSSIACLLGGAENVSTYALPVGPGCGTCPIAGGWCGTGTCGRIAGGGGGTISSCLGWLAMPSRWCCAAILACRAPSDVGWPDGDASGGGALSGGWSWITA